MGGATRPRPHRTLLPTDLFAVASGALAGALERAIPPACRRGVEAPPAPRLAGGEALLEFPEWRPRRPSRRFVPSLCLVNGRAAGVRFELSVLAGGAWSPWVAGAALGDAPFAAAPTRADALAAEVDEFVASLPAEAVRVRLRVAAPAPREILTARWLVTLSAWDGAAPAGAVPAARPARLDVPAVSQMEADAAIRRRLCSPVSVAMVLGYWGVRADLAALAAEIFHPGLDLYGVWPAAVLAAGRRGLGGYLLRFPDWAAAAWCLEAGLPIVASVRYGAGELAGAAIPETPGHLLVLTGHDGDSVFVNDPAAPTAAAAPRRYALGELARVWLERAGVGYVLFRPTTSPSARSPRR